ncbi:rab5 GDP/GTP exchange factor-like isoform X2 [Limulus polyphemus]|nr:rab5 GDP/GTP exchange factor-like isoform X2 [Limulus polyphemus]
MVKELAMRKGTTAHPGEKKQCRMRFESQRFDDFVELMKPIKESAVQEVKKHAQVLIHKVQKCSEWTVNDLSELIQDFYRSMKERFEIHPIFEDTSQEDIEELMNFTEKYLLTRLYKVLFTHFSSKYEENDLAIQKWIQRLGWVTAQHLDFYIDETLPEVRDLIDRAITNIIEMDSRRASLDKIDCIVHCSYHILNFIQLCQDRPASADEFLPALVFIVLKANPPRLKSNIEYITKLSAPGRLMSGEGSYYFTNLCCAVAFIEGLTAESLNLSEDEFDRYVSGAALPPGSCVQNAYLCEGLRIMYQNLADLSDLQQRQEKLQAETISLREDIKEFKEIIAKEVNSTKTMYLSQPYKIPPIVKWAQLASVSHEHTLQGETNSMYPADIYLTKATLVDQNTGQQPVDNMNSSTG